MTKTGALAFRVLAERLEHAEARSLPINFSLQIAA